MYCRYCGKAVDLSTMQCVSCGRKVGPLAGGSGFWDLLEPPAGHEPAPVPPPAPEIQKENPEPKTPADKAESSAALVQAQAEAEAAKKALLARQKQDVDARLALGRRAQRARLIAIVSSALFVLALVGVILLWIHAGSLKSELASYKGETGEQSTEQAEKGPTVPAFQPGEKEDKSSDTTAPSEPDNPVPPAVSNEPAPPQSSEATPPQSFEATPPQSSDETQPDDSSGWISLLPTEEDSDGKDRP